MATVRLERLGDVVTLYLDKPPVNAFDVQFVREASEQVARVDTMSDVGALVVTGAGACFSAGLDLKVVPRYGPAEQREMVQTVNRTIGRLYALSIPTVAAVNGHAIAGGLVLALACDYRVGTNSDCKLGLTEARAGIPFPAAAMAVVQAELAPPVARRLTLTAHNLGPEAALASGVVDELQPPGDVLARARAIAADLGSIPREAYARIKRQLRAATIARIESIITTGADPFLDSWLTAETAGAAADVLTGRGGR